MAHQHQTRPNVL